MADAKKAAPKKQAAKKTETKAAVASSTPELSRTYDQDIKDKQNTELADAVDEHNREVKAGKYYEKPAAVNSYANLEK